MISQNELKKEINRIKAEKEGSNFYDEYDREACFGYYHALMFVAGKLKGRATNGN